MLDIVHTFNKGILEVDPEENAKQNFRDRVVYDKCENCGKNAEMDVLAHGPGVGVLEYACGCIKHCEAGKETQWTTREK